MISLRAMVAASAAGDNESVQLSESEKLCY